MPSIHPNAVDRQLTEEVERIKSSEAEKDAGFTNVLNAALAGSSVPAPGDEPADEQPVA